MKTVSITIPTKNEENYIIDCLKSIVKADYPKNLLQVFVCDGLSTDRTQQLINDFIINYPFIKLIINEMQTTPYALNLGLQASDSEYKIILGAHSEIAPDFIKENIEAFQKMNDEKIACVGGLIENVYENNESKIIGYAMSTPFGVGNAHFRTGRKSEFVDTVAFGAYKKEIFEKIGYFDETLSRNQDDEFNYRIIKNGYKIYLSKNIKSKYYVRASFKKLFNQYYQYGYWKVIVNKKHKKITTFRQIVPAIFVLFNIIGLALSFFSCFITFLFLLSLILYFSLALYEGIKASFNINDKLRLIKSFLILHFSYGIGYLTAIKDSIFLRTFATKKNTIITR